MAEIISGSTTKKPQKQHKKSTRVDLTPMVDLGFLLITFFVFTTSMIKPRALKLMLPKGSDIETTVPESSVMTVILDNDNTVYYYQGKDASLLQKTSNSADGIRPVLLAKKKKVEQLPDNNKMILIIKATKNASYSNMVNMLDEVTINMIPVYFMADLSANEMKGLPLQ